MFAIAGIAFGILSLLIENITVSAVMGVTSFSSFWSILELYEQEKRVERGWFPKTPRR